MVMENELYWMIGGIVFAAASEIIGLLPIRQNTVIQVLLAIGRRVFRGKATGGGDH